jgi:hypothetical protein
MLSTWSVKPEIHVISTMLNCASQIYKRTDRHLSITYPHIDWILLFPLLTNNDLRYLQRSMKPEIRYISIILNQVIERWKRTLRHHHDIYHSHSTSTEETSCRCSQITTHTNCNLEIMVYVSGASPFAFCGPPLNHYWKPRTPKPFLRFEPQNNTQKIHKQYSKNKYANYKIFCLIHKRKNMQKSEF